VPAGSAFFDDQVIQDFWHALHPLHHIACQARFAVCTLRRSVYTGPSQHRHAILRREHHVLRQRGEHPASSRSSDSSGPSLCGACEAKSAHRRA